MYLDTQTPQLCAHHVIVDLWMRKPRKLELLEQRQFNNLLVRRIRELEREVEHGGSVARDYHNSSMPPSPDPPWQKVKRTSSLRQKSGRKLDLTDTPNRTSARRDYGGKPERRPAISARYCAAAVAEGRP